MRDPLAAELHTASKSGTTPAEKVEAIMSVGSVFPAALKQNDAFRQAVSEAYGRLAREGAKVTVTSL